MRLRRAATRVLRPAYSTTQAGGPRTSSSNLSSELVIQRFFHFAFDGIVYIELIENMCDFLYPEDLFNKYLVHIPHRASFTFNNDNDEEMEVYDMIWKQQQGEEMKDLNPSQKEKQDGETKMVNDHMNVEPLVPEEDMLDKGIEDFGEKKASVWYYHKNNCKRWHCQNIVDGPKALCEYHLAKSHSNTPTSVKVATAHSKSCCTITMSHLLKSSFKPTLTGEASSLRAASASIQKNSQSHKRKAGNGLSEDTYYSYSLFSPFHGKDQDDNSKGRVATIDYQQKGFLQQDNIVLIKERDDNKEYINVDNLFDDFSIAGDDGQSDKDYFVGGANNPHVKKGKQ
ncbi:hypothetical protein OsI_07252 [Oryza sativa Indica Group]|uniref:WRC domain-containing protein n=1 Tax=Oryza sativa subsp. indica TaxID=39946 RepID=B8AHY9_ORYSI|nr:hypothetical protein OsI_07252 [Oryza sativa Indica Group]